MITLCRIRSGSGTEPSAIHYRVLLSIAYDLMFQAEVLGACFGQYVWITNPLSHWKSFGDCIQSVS